MYSMGVDVLVAKREFLVPENIGMVPIVGAELCWSFYATKPIAIEDGYCTG